MEASSEVVQTSRGPVEFCKKGKAPYVLGFHGTPGMHDGVSCLFDWYVDNGFGIITVSRCGYGRTPLEHGETFAEAADTYAAFLDKLEIDKVIVHAGSGGGPSSIYFAARHPNRV